MYGIIVRKRWKNMIVRFSVENFRSFKERQTLFLNAVSTCKEWKDENTAVENGNRLLRSAVVYGANASGKTNLFLAMERMRMFMLSSVNMEKQANLLVVEPFLLSLDALNRPETFEIQFTLDGKIFTYGFSLLLVGSKPDQYEVVNEWLLENVKKHEVVYFLRERRKGADDGFVNIISVNKDRMPLGVGLEARTRPDVLFFTVAAQFAEPTCQMISDYIRLNVNVVSGLNHASLTVFSRNQLTSDGNVGESIKKFIHDADTGIKDLKIDANGQIVSFHDQYDAHLNAIGRLAMNFQFSESQGTSKLFDLSGPLIDTLNNGRIMIVDELDAKLHPLLVRRLIMLFNNSETNSKNAQLIINVQSPDLLAYKEYYAPRKRMMPRLRRDQFFFVEKDNGEASVLTSLIEFKKENGMKMRNDASFAKEYMEGSFGGIPYVSDLIKFEK
jgi:AAA15 family ATPase/GTPase